MLCAISLQGQIGRGCLRLITLFAAIVFFTTDALAVHYKITPLSGMDSLSEGTLLMDKSGNLFGTSIDGGDFRSGSVFEFVRDGTNWTYRTLYSFCPKPACKDGFGGDYGRLVMDTNGNLYGITSGQERNSVRDHPSTAYKLMPGKNGGPWKIKVLYTFCRSNEQTCADGLYPRGNLTYAGALGGAPYDGVSPLYGVAMYGGPAGLGVLYTLNPNPVKGQNAQSVIYDFCAQADCADGKYPVEVTADAQGNLFGTAIVGTSMDEGIAFVMSVDSDTGIWKERILATLDAAPGSGLISDPSGNLYGTSGGGGGHCNAGSCGQIYELHLNGSGSYDVQYLHRFCQTKNCRGGSNPWGDLVRDAAGNLYGVTTGKLRAYPGSVYALLASGTFKTLYSFCGSESECYDSPWAGLTMDSYGNLFGVADSNLFSAFELYHK